MRFFIFRLRTRISWVQNAEKNLEEKRLHCMSSSSSPTFLLYPFPLFPSLINYSWVCFANNTTRGAAGGWVDVTAIKAFENVVALLNGF